MQADRTPSIPTAPGPADRTPESAHGHHPVHYPVHHPAHAPTPRAYLRTVAAGLVLALTVPPAVPVAAALVQSAVAPAPVASTETDARAVPGTAWAQDDPDTSTDSDAAADDDSATDRSTDPSADAIARLTVVPHGDQSFDLLTGETTLPDGGVIVDTETGLRLDAGFVRYREGDYIEARDATAETAGGSLSAPALRIDVPTLVATAPEGVRYEREGLELIADAAELRFGSELVRFEHPTGESLDLEARALLLDIRTGDALLLGPYRFQDGPFVLTDDREDAALQLRPVTTDAGTPTYRAANEVDEDLWTRMAPLL